MAPTSGSGARAPIWLVYTSGTTGEPKGVVMGHRAAARRIAWSETTYGLRAGRMLIKTNYVFGAAEVRYHSSAFAGAAAMPTPCLYLACARFSSLPVAFLGADAVGAAVATRARRHHGARTHRSRTQSTDNA